MADDASVAPGAPASPPPAWLARAWLLPALAAPALLAAVIARGDLEGAGLALVGAASAGAAWALRVLTRPRRFTYRAAGRALALALAAVGVFPALAFGTDGDSAWRMIAFLAGILGFGAALGAGLVFARVPGPADTATSRLVLVALAGAPLLMLVATGSREVSMLAFGCLAVASASWLLAGRVTGRVMTRVLRGGPRLVRLTGDPATRAPGDVRGLVRASLVPLFFAYAVGAWADAVLTTEDPFARAGEIVRVAYVVLALAGVLVVPWKWILDAVTLRVHDPATGVAERLRLPGLLQDLVGVGALVGLASDALEGGRAASLGGLGTAFLTALVTAWQLLPVALVPTAVYFKWGFRGDVRAFLREIPTREVSHLRDLDVVEAAHHAPASP